MLRIACGNAFAWRLAALGREWLAGALRVSYLVWPTCGGAGEDRGGSPQLLAAPVGLQDIHLHGAGRPGRLATRKQLLVGSSSVRVEVSVHCLDCWRQWAQPGWPQPGHAAMDDCGTVWDS